jgi:hypothetical protein
MTRPEGLLLPAGIAAHHGLLVALRLRSWRPPRWGWWLLAAFLALWGPWFAWRWWYYGHPFPNTYYVKAGDGADPAYHAKLWANGLYYLKTWVTQWNILPALPLSLWGWWGAGSRARRAGLLVVPLGLLYLLYAAKVGGDFMGLHRFVLPVAVWVAVGVGLGLNALWSRLERPLARAGVVALALGLVAASAVTQERLIETSTAPNNLKSDRGMDTPAYLKRYAEERGAIGKMLAPCLREDDFSIVGGVGAQPYYGRMKAIDVFGLVSEDIAHNVKPTSTRAGHNKHAPDALLEKYKPTFLFSCYAIHKKPNPKVRLTCNDGWWAKRGYERVTLKVPGLERSGPYYTFLARKERAFRCEAGGG